MLIIEDDPDLVRVLCDVLSIEGAEVISTELVSAAIDLLHSSSFDLVILDLNLPDNHGSAVMDSMEKAEIITPVIILTSGDMDTAKSTTVSRAADYMLKPVAIGELVSVLKRHLAATRSGDL